MLERRGIELRLAHPDGHDRREPRQSGTSVVIDVIERPLELRGGGDGSIGPEQEPRLQHRGTEMVGLFSQQRGDGLLRLFVLLLRQEDHGLAEQQPGVVRGLGQPFRED